MHDLVPYIILSIICIQIFFFVKNLLRMNQFSKIFSSDENSWRLRWNSAHLVNGIYADGNKIFKSIVTSINKYLGNSAGSVIDFGLLKDAVDRHCDSVENDIAVQTPIPLYWGLAGTMAGVIIGLWDLLDSDAILTLMGSSGGVINVASQNAANGINSLLSGVAWAMLASICGIVLTTINSLLFKRCKLKEEAGKNSFLAWMQSVLLPELSTDTSDALNALVKNLNNFNKTFAENTANLGEALFKVNDSYKIQGQVIKAVHDMDVMKMAKANVRVLQELKECTDKLEAFNEYLDDIHGYTDAIHRFESLFRAEAQRIRILEDIKDFFTRHKGEIAKSTADADNALKDALKSIKESTSDNVEELRNRFMEQSEAFKDIIKAEKESFEQLASDVRAQFSAKMADMPEINKHLEEIADIPVRLDKLLNRIEESNLRLAKDFSKTIKESMQASNNNRAPQTEDMVMHSEKPSTPEWMKVTGWLAIVIIAISCVFNVVTSILKENYESPYPVVEQIAPIVVPTKEEPKDSVASDSVKVDSAHSVNAENPNP